jgi:hypothetical protein
MGSALGRAKRRGGYRFKSRITRDSRRLAYASAPPQFDRNSAGGSSLCVRPKIWSKTPKPLSTNSPIARELRTWLAAFHLCAPLLDALYGSASPGKLMMQCDAESDAIMNR